MSTPSLLLPMAKIRVFHVVGETQYQGSCRFHLFSDCRHLVRPRRWGPMDMTGVIETATTEETSRLICKHCKKRQSRATGSPAVPVCESVPPVA